MQRFYADSRTVLLLFVLYHASDAWLPTVFPHVAASSGRHLALGTTQLNVLSQPTLAEDAPALTAGQPMNIGLLVEPTPFSHVSGYSNRFKEMLKYLNKAGDKVEIVTVDDLQEPDEKFGSYPINNIKGFRFPLYDEISLTFDAKQRLVWKTMSRFRPDIIHCTSPGFIVFAAIFTAKMLGIPIVLSYHTHLPMYTKEYLTWLPACELKPSGVMNPKFLSVLF